MSGCCFAGTECQKWVCASHIIDIRQMWFISEPKKLTVCCCAKSSCIIEIYCRMSDMVRSPVSSFTHSSSFMQVTRILVRYPWCTTIDRSFDPSIDWSTVDVLCRFPLLRAVFFGIFSSSISRYIIRSGAFWIPFLFGGCFFFIHFEFLTQLNLKPKEAISFWCRMRLEKSIKYVKKRRK